MMQTFKRVFLVITVTCLIFATNLSVSNSMAAPAFNCATATTGVPLEECEALVAFYTSTNGDNWTNTTQYKNVWFSAQDVDLWYGVTVQSGHVYDIDLVNNNLTGSLPSALGDLEGLWTLNLSGNKITGAIPQELFNLFDIHEIDFSGNLLSGSIPAAIGTGNAEDLQKFNVTGNNLSGVIPPEIGFAVNLTHLSLGSNDLYGPIPVAMTNLTSLSLLQLDNNGLWAVDSTLKTFLNSKSTGWNLAQSAQGLYPTNNGYAGWGSGTGHPKFIFSQAWFDSPFTYTSSEYRLRIYRKSDYSLVFSENKLAYVNDGNPNNDMCPNYADWTVPGRCTFEATTIPSLVPGVEYYWTVETIKQDLSFVLFDSPHYFVVPPAPVSYQPEGTVAVNNPVYSWQPVDGARKYYLWFGDTATHKIKEAMVDPSLCTEELCTYSFITTTIAGTEYFWKVSGVINLELNDLSAFSAVKSFIRQNPPEVVSPTGGVKTTARNPRFTWTKTVDATQYKVLIDSGGTPAGEKVVSSSVCGATECSSTADLSLVNGSYNWKVIAFTGSWGDSGNPGSFTKVSPPTPQFPAISVTTGNPKLIWTRVADQTRYQIQLFTSAGAKKLDKTFDTSVCGSTTCSYTPSPALGLTNGAYKWKVRAGNAVQWGDFSAVKTFNKVTAPAPVTPSGTITLTNPKFTWKKIPGATKYYIQLQKSTGTLVKNIEVKTLSCTATTCSYTPSPALSLAKGQYRWHVRAFNGYYGPYGVFVNFTVK